MTDYEIRAIERKEKPALVRRNGFIPGVIYGRNFKSENVKFDEKKFLKFLHSYSHKGKIKVKLHDDIRLCLIKEIQRDPVLGKIIHVSMQVVSEEDIVRQKVPIIFQGRDKLASKKQTLQIFTSEVEISGKAAEIPEAIYIDLNDRKIGDEITVADIVVGPSLKVMDDPNKIYAVVSSLDEYTQDGENTQNVENAESEKNS